jgi:hypothetical protein
MYNFHRTMVPTHWQQQPQLLTPLRFVNHSFVPIMMQQQPMFWGGGFYGGPSFYPGPGHPVYQAMAPIQQPQHQYRPPSSGPSRSRRRKKGSRKAEPQHPYHVIHESSRTVFYDHSTGVDLGRPQIGASNNPGIGKVWRTPPKKPFMADCNST